MTPTHKVREVWELKHKRALDDISEKIFKVEQALDLLIQTRDKIEAMTFEDMLFEFLAERGSEK